MDAGLDLTESLSRDADLGDLGGYPRRHEPGLGDAGWQMPGYSAVNLGLGRRLSGPQ